MTFSGCTHKKLKGFFTRKIGKDYHWFKQWTPQLKHIVYINANFLKNSNVFHLSKVSGDCEIFIHQVRHDTSS